MNRINEAPIEYEEAYFFELYHRQYGKTYIEDFPNLRAMGTRRLARIRPLLPRNRTTPGPVTPVTGEPEKLLDVGCAYGPFLQAAAQEGFEVCGIDPAEGAVRYVRDTLKLPAFRGLFPPPAQGGKAGEYRFPPASFSVVTLWYVIEHLVNLAEALTEAKRILRDGGVLAFSTPSCSGISGRTSLGTFLEKSPPDHWTIWSPRVTRGLLKHHGFTLKKIVSTGHHPERFPLVGTWCRSKQGPLYQFLLRISQICGLGDTFEVYARKDPAPPKKPAPQPEAPSNPQG
jgi:2-polyprenyl-3-methyl-5-hydroxy-6-metoxy-1,4-benzoquinol methylase